MIALVTGGTRGIGLATALALHAAGHEVVVASRTAPEKLPDGLHFQHMDVSNPEAIDLAITQIENTHGPIEILVANAGVTQDSLLMRMSDADLDQVLQTNLSGSIRLARRVLRNMLRAKAGRIIFVSSVVGMMGSAGQVNYAASKAGLIGAARSLTREISSRGITVNVVAPGFIETDMTSVLAEPMQQSILASIPAHRFGTPEEVAQMIVFLASPSAAYITGAVIPIDGGLGMGH